MKFALFNKWLLIAIFIFSALATAKESELDKVINFLVHQGVVTQEEAAKLLADLAVQKQIDKEKQKEFTLVAEKSLKLSGYIQSRFQALEEDGKIDGFDVRRARLTLKGDITPRVSYKLQQEFGGGSAKLVDADLGFEYNRHLKLNIGQFKIPVSQENLASSNKFELINRSQVVEALVARGKDVAGNQNGRDIGLLLSGSLWQSSNKTILDYSLGLFNGSGVNGQDKDEQKDIAGRLVVHPLSGLSVGGSFYAGGLSNKLKQDYHRDRVNAEIACEYRTLSIKGEYIKGKDGEFDKSAGKFILAKDSYTNKNGYYIQAGYYVIPKVLQAVARYDTFDPDANQSQDAANACTLGLNWSPNKSARLQLNYEIRNEQGEDIDNNAFVAQLQVGY